jgi:ketosteroid isomerase-like protein
MAEREARVEAKHAYDPRGADAMAGDAAAALERERGLWEAYRAKDRARLHSLIHPDALDVGPAGPLDRDAVISAVARMEIAGFEIDDLLVRTFGDMEIVSYRSTVEGTYDGKPFPAPVVRASTAWRRDGATWVVVHRHESPSR